MDSRGAGFCYCQVTSFCFEVSGWLTFVSCLHSVGVAVVSGRLGRILYAFVPRPPAVQVQQLRGAEGLLGSRVGESTDHIWGSFGEAVGLRVTERKV